MAGVVANSVESAPIAGENIRASSISGGRLTFAAPGVCLPCVDAKMGAGPCGRSNWLWGSGFRSGP